MKLPFVVLFLLLIPSICCFQRSHNSVSGNTHRDPEFFPETNNFKNATDELNNDSVNGTFDYYICKNRTENSNCRCDDQEIECDPSLMIPIHPHPDYDYSPDDDAPEKPIFENLNIKIINESIVVKIAIFHDNNIEKLEKDKILPGIQHTVEILDLPKNKIYEIENGAFDKFKSLKKLNLYGNYLTNITAEIFTKQLGSTLIDLDLGHNDLSIFTVDFTNLIKLEQLYLGKNLDFNKNGLFAIFIFPKSLSNLRILKLFDCGIDGFHDDAFVNLIKLEELDLSENPLVAVPSALNKLVNLQYLHLDGTYIINLNSTSFKYNNKLNDFYMSSSFLQRIDNCTFCNKPNLKSIILHNNPSFSFIHENAFGNIFSQAPSLDTFFVELCNLSMIPENLLNWYTVKEFGLGKNPFICNCSMAWLINDILSPTHSMNMKEYSPDGDGYHLNIFKCSGPLALKNVPFIKLSEKFCKNEIVKKQLPECKNEFSWTFQNFVVFGLAFVFGMFAVLLCQYLLRLKKQRSAFGYREANKFQEDFGNNLNVTKF